MKRMMFCCVMAVCILSPLAAQFNPPAGGDDVADLRSPVFVSGGSHVTSFESPQADSLNPAAGALNQRITLDLSYIGLLGFSDLAEDRGWQGHGFNLGGTIPTKFGVFSTSLNFLTSSLSSIATGTFVTLNTSFAKDLYPDFLIGAGLKFTVGGADRIDWGLSGDLGVIHILGDLGFMKDFRWAFALQNLGRSYAPAEGVSGSPSPFTPAFGGAGTLFKTKDFSFEVLSDISLPSFQNFRFNIGSSLSFRDFITLSTGLRLDIRQLATADLPARSLVPSIGLAFNFMTNLKEDESFITKQGWNHSEVKTRVSATPFMEDTWAFGLGMNVPLGVIDTNPPSVTIDYTDGKYISPNNDGKSDDLVFPIKITDQRFVQSYSLKIMREDGTIIREIKNKDERPENSQIKNILSRLVAVKKGISIPETLRWDGTADDGSIAPDGTYVFVIESADDNGNTVKTAPLKIHVDNTAPIVTISPLSGDNLIFSPNGDGIKDTLKITQTGSTENSWQMEILDASGKVVRSFRQQSSKPQEIVWDGKTDAGVPVPDGVYSYVVKTTDDAQNSGSAGLENIIVNTERTPIHVTIENSFFSPNKDNVQEEMIFKLDIPVRSGIDTWELNILDPASTVQRTFTGKGEPPLKLAFDGIGNKGTVLPEGKYHGMLKVIYRNGNSPMESSPEFTLDITAPQVSIRTSSEIFSPNGDGNKDTITIFQETGREETWQGIITDAKNTTVKTYTWYGNAEPSFDWDGRNDKGILQPDGTYKYVIRSTDKAGNASAREVTFRLNTEETPVILSADLEAFSPNGDGENDRIRIIPQLRITEGIASYEVRILDAAGKVVKTFTGKNRIENSFTWDGIGNDGKKNPDGQYKAEIVLSYENGNRPQASSGFFFLDTIKPSAEISADHILFSPDGDGKKDSVVIRQTSSREDVWEGKIISAKGTTVRNYFWKGTTPTLTWDGKDEAGNVVEDGTYRYILSSKDKAGNAFETRIDQIAIDTRSARVFITVDAVGFSPNGDNFAEEVKFTPYISLREGITNWSLNIVSGNGSVVRQFTNTTQVPAQITWDGKNTSGAVVEGSYKGVFTVIYAKGNEPSAETTAFLLDISAPKVQTAVSPKPFSPDNDGIDDELTITITTNDSSEIRDWSLKIFDPMNKVFREYTGKGKPGNIIWDGRSLNGELVQAAEDYPYTLTVTDTLGNSFNEKGIIPIDVLVLRDGDKLKIRISSINFAPNSPGLMVDDKTQIEKNLRVLKRLAEILNKYGRYRIRIEGHAVRVYWNDPVRGAREEENELKPLSLSRAETVKAELVKLGVEASRVSTAGLGGSEPVVPHDDAENRWKNRRVEFILIR